jgi:sulfide:quinone oxidoreductase
MSRTASARTLWEDMTAGTPSHLPRRMRIVIAGGGVAALEALLALRADAGELVDITLVADTDTFSYRSLQVGEAFGVGYPRRYSLPALVADVGARFVKAPVTGIHAGPRELLVGNGDAISYDALLVALGARSVPAFDHGSTFAPASFEEILDDLREDFASDVTIVVPRGVSWSLAAYELALMTAAWNERRSVAVRVVTHEAAPLEIFGAEASAVVAEALRSAGVEVVAGVKADVPHDGLVRTGDHWLPASRIVSLPVHVGPRVYGLPSTPDGYLDCDQHGRVRSVPGVWAAGDGTAQPIKQGGLASQQAEAAAADIARRSGASTRPRPFRPVLRGLLRTATGPLYLRRALAGDRTAPTVSSEPLWWPPSKVASRRLAAHLARLDVEASAGRRLPSGGFALTAIR